MVSGSVNASSFSLRDIDASNLRALQIFDISKDRYYGRRFQVLYITDFPVITAPIKFSKILRKIKRIAKEEYDLSNLKEVKGFLGTLKEIEQDSRFAFAKRGCVYRFFTKFQRGFKSGSHLEKIQAIQALVQAKINEEDVDNLDLDVRMAEIKKLISFPEVEEALLVLIDDCLRADQLDDALKTTGCLIDYRKSDVEFARIAHAFLEKGELAKATYAVERISYKSLEKTEIVQNIVMVHLSNDQPDFETALKSISLIFPSEANLEVIESLRKMVYNQEYEETTIGKTF